MEMILQINDLSGKLDPEEVASRINNFEFLLIEDEAEGEEGVWLQFRSELTDIKKIVKSVNAFYSNCEKYFGAGVIRANYQLNYRYTTEDLESCDFVGLMVMQELPYAELGEWNGEICQSCNRLLTSDIQNITLTKPPTLPLQATLTNNLITDSDLCAVFNKFNVTCEKIPPYVECYRVTHQGVFRLKGASKSICETCGFSKDVAAIDYYIHDKKCSGRVRRSPVIFSKMGKAFDYMVSDSGIGSVKRSGDAYGVLTFPQVHVFSKGLYRQMTSVYPSLADDFISRLVPASVCDD